MAIIVVSVLVALIIVNSMVHAAHVAALEREIDKDNADIRRSAQEVERQTPALRETFKGDSKAQADIDTVDKYAHDATTAAGSDAAPSPASSGVTLAQFQQVKNGMKLEKVEEIFGSSGEVMSDSDIAGHKTTMYGWKGRDSLGANCNVMIQDGRVCMKAQFGLK
jgi:hypothetical protein